MPAGIIELVSEPLSTQLQNSCPFHYLPHHVIVRQGRQTTKLQIVYDRSAKGVDDMHFLNDCLQTGPNFIPKLLNILIKFRTHPVALIANIEKVFLKVESDRNMLRFLWFEEPSNRNSKVIHL